MSEIKVVHPDDLEVEIKSGAMTRLAGVLMRIFALALGIDVPDRDPAGHTVYCDV